MRSSAHLVAGDDMIARLDTGDALSHALYNACSLVPQNAWEQALRVCTHDSTSRLLGLDLLQPDSRMSEQARSGEAGLHHRLN